jgi:hypothetical protein
VRQDLVVVAATARKDAANSGEAHEMAILPIIAPPNFHMLTTNATVD